MSACTNKTSPEVLYRNVRAQIRAGNLEAASGIAHAGLARWRSQPNSREYSEFKILTAETFLAQGNPRDALPLVEPASPAGRISAEFAARRLLCLGYARALLAAYKDAAPLLDRAAIHAERSNLPLVLAEVELRRGFLFVRTEDPAAAEKCYLRARDLAVQQHDVYLEASAIANLGYNRLYRSQFDEALAFFEQSLPMLEKVQARGSTAMALSNIGRCYYGLGDYDRAIEFQTTAVTLARPVGDRFRLPIMLGALAETHYARGDLPKAIENYQSALAILRESGEKLTTVQWLCSLAYLELEEGDVPSAARNAVEALNISREVDAAGLRTLAVLIQAQVDTSKGNFTAAEKGFREVLKIPAAGERNQWAAYNNLGLLYAQMGRWHEARTEFQNSVSIVEHSREKLARDEWKLSFQASAIKMYQDYVDYLVSRGAAAEALEVAEFSKARVLAQKLGLAQTVRRPVPAARFHQIALTEHAALVSYWFAPKRSFVWVVTPARVQVFPLPPDKEIRPLIDTYQSAIQSLRDPVATANPAGTRLSQILLDPVRKAVPHEKRFIVVPDGALHEFNLETLPAGNHYWLEDASVTVTPSLAVLESGSRTKPAPRNSLLLIGNSHPPTDEYGPLPAVEKELASVRTRLSGWQQTVLTGDAAHPAAYREAAPGRFSLIHFSAHAAANRRDPLESAVILSARNEQFRLYAREIAAIPLHARLVTISACRGAGSRTYSGEGLVGFAWAFLQAGAGNVIAGLWEVNDSSTASLMDTLYGRLAAGDSPADALHAAKLALLHSGGPWQKPYYWSAFETLSRTGL